MIGHRARRSHGARDARFSTFAETYCTSLRSIGSGFPGLRNQRFSSGWKPNRVLQLRCRHRHWLQLLKDLVPSVKQVNVMFNPRTSPYNALFLKSIEAAAPSFGMFAISQRMSAFTPLAGVKWIFLTQPKPTLLIPSGHSGELTGPAHRPLVADRAMEAWYHPSIA